mgnify:CR=1 FL=1
MTELTELFATDDMNKLKQELDRLVRTKDYKTINTLLRRNPNIWALNTRELNEEIPCADRHFTKRKGIMKFESKPVSTNTRKPKQTTPQSDVYESQLYEPNSGSYGYVSRIRSRSYST